MMAKTENFDQDEISIIQCRQLRKTIHYLYQRSPFYRDLFDRDHIIPAEIKSLEDLSLIPPTTREDLVREGERFLCVRPEEVADIMVTPGMSGDPFLFKITESDLSRLAYNEQLSAKIAGVEEKDTVALVLSLDSCSMAGLACYYGLRRLGATVLRIGHLSMDLIVAYLGEVRPSVIVGAPSVLKHITQQIERQHNGLVNSQVRKLICVDEPIRQKDFSLNELGDYLARSWNAKLFSLYRNTELATSLCECEEGCGGHLHPELAHVEILDEKGNRVQDGTIGELCVTPFGVTGMPVARYRTGDYSFINNTPCTCGRATLRLGPILGQKGITWNHKGNIIYPAELHGIVLGDPDIQSHVVLLETDAQGAEQVTLLIETGYVQVCTQITARIHERLGLDLECRIASPQELRALQMPNMHYKQRFIVDRRRSTL